MPTLEDAIALAAKAHAGQKDKAGEPYILHPLRVMQRQASDALRMVAVLHDVVEDTDVTLADLVAAGYPPEVVRAVDALTRREDETYEAFIERLLPVPLAVEVKRADLEDNLDLRRRIRITPDQEARILRYHRALERLAAARTP